MRNRRRITRVTRKTSSRKVRPAVQAARNFEERDDQYAAEGIQQGLLARKKPA